MIGYIVSCIGIALLLFVAFVKIWDKLYRRYIVRWRDVEGNNGYSIVMACSKIRAGRKALQLIPMIHIITKVVRCRESNL